MARGFTLIELLVVIALIGVLVAILLPAVQQAREAGRRVTCANHLKQLGIAVHSYLDLKKEFPYGSAYGFPGMPSKTPDGGTTWITAILPYLEQQVLFDTFDFNQPMDAAANITAARTPLKVLTCPSDGSSYNPILDYRCTCCSPDWQRVSHGLWYMGSMGPAECSAGCPFCPNPNSSATNPCCQGTACGQGGTAPGMFHRHYNPPSVRTIRATDVQDGLSGTLLAGETVPAQNFHSVAFSINLPLASTNIPLNYRVRSPDPIDASMPDATLHTKNKVEYFNGFKSFHPSGVQFLFADGAVRMLTQGTDFDLINQLGTRAGEEAAQLP